MPRKTLNTLSSPDARLKFEVREFWNARVPDAQELTVHQEVILRLSGGVSELRVLELGCGTGTLSAELARRGAVVTAIDFSDGMLRLARERHGEMGITFIQADVLSLDLSQRFDLIVGTFFLHEIAAASFPQVADVLDRHLTVGGRGLFVENSFFNPLFRFLRREFVDRGKLRKLGSLDETPFDAERFTMLQARFHTERRVDTFRLFRRIAGQFMVGVPGLDWRKKVAERLDDVINMLPPTNRFKLAWSYTQTIVIRRT